MFRVDKPKAALQPALNKVNIKEKINQLSKNYHDRNRHQNLHDQRVTDKLGNVIEATRPLLPTNHQSENDDGLLEQKAYKDNNEKPMKKSPKEPSPPQLRQYTRTTRNSSKTLQLHQTASTENATLDNVKRQPLGVKQQVDNQAQQQVEPISTISNAIKVVSRIPRLSLRAPSQINILQSLKPKPLSIEEKAETEEAQDKSMQVEEEEIEDIDKSTSRDALFLCFDYVKDIYQYLRYLEDTQSIREKYLEDQKIFTPKVRQRLINWCIDIHQQLRLLPETLYLTVATIDRFFQNFNVTQQNQVQLVALGATLIASKYEEIYPPDVSDLVHMSQNAYTKREILKIEMSILKQLKFELGRPIPLAFLRRYSKAASCDKRMHDIAKYLMELSLTEYECVHWRPSLLAAAALYISLELTRNKPSASSLNKAGNDSSWNKTLIHYTQFDRKQLLSPVATLCKTLKKAQKSPASYMCVKKYSSTIAGCPELKSLKIDHLIKICEQKL